MQRACPLSRVWAGVRPQRLQGSASASPLDRSYGVNTPLAAIRLWALWYPLIIMNTNKALREEADFTKTDALRRESGEAVIESLPIPRPPLRVLERGGDEGTNVVPLRNPNKALWEKGDFTQIAALMRESGEAMVRSLGIAPPLRVLDLGCGDGTTAVPLARVGADVVGIDIARNLLEAGNKRAAQAGLARLKFEEGDACDLERVADDVFDLTLSVFGAMFAPKPFNVAREMVRVTKPGGRIVMGNWIPNDPTSFVSQLLKISSSFTPPPPEGFVSPMTWGVESHIVERFGQAGVPREKISMVKDTFRFISADKSPAQVIESFRQYYGPTMNAYEAAENNGKVNELHRQLVELAEDQNQSRNGGTSISATYLRVAVCL
jgi:ubiquinone/menaquinone biosynthesis C-methylase UbiE